MTYSIKLNLARNCLKYIIKTYGINEIFIPYYTCETVWQSIKDVGCKIKFYHIDKNFLPMYKFKQNDYILYINYFGLFEKNSKYLAEKYKNLIVDNTHSFYSEHIGLASFNSFRKFFKVTNGAELHTEKFSDEFFETDYLELGNYNIHENYGNFIKNELKLNQEHKIKLINPNITKFLKDLHFNQDKKTRRELYKLYEKELGKHNSLTISLGDSIPYCYPFSPNSEEIFEKISKNNLILLHLWKNFPITMYESKFLNNLIALPLNDKEYANKIIDCLK